MAFSPMIPTRRHAFGQPGVSGRRAVAGEKQTYGRHVIHDRHRVRVGLIVGRAEGDGIPARGTQKPRLCVGKMRPLECQAGVFEFISISRASIGAPSAVIPAVIPEFHIARSLLGLHASGGGGISGGVFDDHTETDLDPRFRDSVMKFVQAWFDTLKSSALTMITLARSKATG